MKNKILLTLVVWALSYGSLLAENTDSLFFWSCKKGESEVYLLGSIHAVKENFYPLDLKIDMASNKCDNLVLEVIPDSVKNDEMVQYMLYPIGTSLDKKLSKSTYKKIVKQATKYGLDESYLKLMRVGYALLTMTGFELIDHNIKEKFGIDNMLYSKAKSANKTVFQLEEPVDQFRVITAMDKLSDEYISYSIDQLDSTAIGIEKMMSAWKAGDDELIMQYALEDTEKFPEVKDFHKVILYDRNSKMSDSLNEIITRKSGKYFVVVGAGHLIGRDSMVEILRKKGYDVQRQTRSIK